MIQPSGVVSAERCTKVWNPNWFEILSLKPLFALGHFKRRLIHLQWYWWNPYALFTPDFCCVYRVALLKVILIFRSKHTSDAVKLLYLTDDMWLIDDLEATYRFLAILHKNEEHIFMEWNAYPESAECLMIVPLNWGSICVSFGFMMNVLGVLES